MTCRPRPHPGAGRTRVARRHVLQTAGAAMATLSGLVALDGSASATARRAGTDPARGASAQARSDLPSIAGARITSVVRAGARLIAVGRRDSGAAAVWVRDGDSSWQPAAGEFPGADLAGITVHDDVLVAVGSVRRRPAVWTSTDAATWRRAVVDAPGGTLTAAAASPAGILAVGVRSDGETAEGAGPLVLSETGRGEWAAVSTHGLVDSAHAPLTALTRHRGRWSAASHTVDGAALWESGDGVRWRPIQAPAGPGVVISSLRTYGSTLLAAGSTVADTQPRLWQQEGSGWDEIRAVRGSPVENGVLYDVVPPEAGGAGLLVGARAGQALTVDTDEL